MESKHELIGTNPIHFIGIGGAGMSAIAKVLLEMGVAVSGSDLKESRYTRSLVAAGAAIAIGHGAENLPEAGVVVISSAIPEYNLELRAAHERGLHIVRRAEMLGEILSNHQVGIAVGGTHGKTTTTSMIAHILDRVGLDPTFLIGGELNDSGSNARHGGGRFCVVEADESDGSLVHLKPMIAVVTNIDRDHLDYHKSFENLTALFKQWLTDLPEDGRAVVSGDGSIAETIAVAAAPAYRTFGKEAHNDLALLSMTLSGFGSNFEVAAATGGERVTVRLEVPGEHNIQNALAALSVVCEVGVDLQAAAGALADFQGARRRFQLLGEGGGVAVIDDYAHHPTEVAATIAAGRASGRQRVICVFQPHRFTRTQLLAEEFGEALAAADQVILTNIYNAGEEPIPGVSGKLVVDEVLRRHPRIPVAYIPERSELADYLGARVRPGDLVIMMGAGDIGGVGHELAERLKGAG